MKPENQHIELDWIKRCLNMRQRKQRYTVLMMILKSATKHFTTASIKQLTY